PDPDPGDELVVGTARTSAPMFVASAALVGVSVLIAVAAGPLAEVTARAGSDLIERAPYVQAVLGSGVAP
ncbi:MAG: Na+/H+ antiporter subunit D, partial [Actinomycetota bacterium]|nr:Na+/H+ antiporter subunit D [Actinomycetota bacterium]